MRRWSSKLYHVNFLLWYELRHGFVHGLNIPAHHIACNKGEFKLAQSLLKDGGVGWTLTFA
jgi:hypothetical protein